jgi:hypothetical protein
MEIRCQKKWEMLDKVMEVFESNQTVMGLRKLKNHQKDSSRQKLALIQ